jgi:hypothetical protein
MTSPRKRLRAPTPTFNIIVVGRRQSGKTSIIRTLLRNLHLAPGASHSESIDQIAIYESRGPRTRERTSVTVEAIEHGEHAQVTFIDTPGLDAIYGDALEGDRAVSEVIANIEARFQDTLQHVRLRALAYPSALTRSLQETRVIRTSSRSAEAHIHVCLYFLSPASFTLHDDLNLPPTPAASPKRKLSGMRSHSTPDLSLAVQPNGLPGSAGSEKVERIDGDVELLEMSQLDVRLIKRLSQRGAWSVSPKTD